MANSVAAALAEHGLTHFADRLVRTGDEVRSGYTVYRLWGRGYLPYLRDTSGRRASHSLIDDSPGFPTAGIARDFGEELIASRAYNQAAVDRGYVLEVHPPWYEVSADISPPADSPMGCHFSELAREAEQRETVQREMDQ